MNHRCHVVPTPDGLGAGGGMFGTLGLLRIHQVRPPQRAQQSFAEGVGLKTSYRGFEHL